MGDYIVTSHWYMRSGDIEAFLAFDLLESKVNALPQDELLSPEDERTVLSFKKAADRRRAGKPDDGPFALDN